MTSPLSVLLSLSSQRQCKIKSTFYLHQYIYVIFDNERTVKSIQIEDRSKNRKYTAKLAYFVALYTVKYYNLVYMAGIGIFTKQMIVIDNDIYVVFCYCHLTKAAIIMLDISYIILYIISYYNHIFFTMLCYVILYYIISYTLRHITLHYVISHLPPPPLPSSH